MQTAQALLQLQGIDLDIIRTEKALDELPQRAKIVALRERRDEVAQKGVQITEMSNANDIQADRLYEEDAQQEARIAELQESIRSTQDYRVITSLTRDLEGCTKRREKLSFELNLLEEKSQKILIVAKQVEDALKKLEQQEAQVTKDFIAEGSRLKEKIQDLRAKRDILITVLEPALYADYESVSSKKGGIAVSLFDGSHCSVCRVELPEGQVHELLTGPIISICPNCHRIIVTRKIEESE